MDSKINLNIFHAFLDLSENQITLFSDPLGRLQPDTECGRGRTGLHEPPLVSGVPGPGIPLLGNLSLDWEFQQRLGKNLGN